MKNFFKSIREAFKISHALLVYRKAALEMAKDLIRFKSENAVSRGFKNPQQREKEVAIEAEALLLEYLAKVKSNGV